MTLNLEAETGVVNPPAKEHQSSLAATGDWERSLGGFLLQSAAAAGHLGW